MDGKRRKGFTLVEMLVVIAVLGILVAMSIVALSGVRNRGKIEKTRALVASVIGAVEAYYEEYKFYPPDGHDNPNDAAGREGAGALAYLLLLEHSYVQESGSGNNATTLKQTKRVGPFLKGIKSGSLSKKRPDGTTMEKFLEGDDTIELIDAWRRPLEYDNASTTANGGKGGNGVYTPLTGNHHIDSKHDAKHAKDPREVNPKVKDENHNFYLWSNGTPGKQNGWEPKPIANWNSSG